MRRLRQEGAARQRQRRSKGGGGRGLVGLRLPALLSRRNLPALVVTLHLTVVRMFCGFITGECDTPDAIQLQYEGRLQEGTQQTRPCKPTPQCERDYIILYHLMETRSIHPLAAQVMFLTSAMLSGAGASTNLALVGQTLVGEPRYQLPAGGEGGAATNAPACVEAPRAGDQQRSSSSSQRHFVAGVGNLAGSMVSIPMVKRVGTGPAGSCSEGLAEAALRKAALR